MGVWSRGAIQLEMVNLTILKKISGLNDSEARKLDVLIDLAELETFDGLMIPASGTITRVLVHSHVVVDLGSDHENAEAELRKRIRTTGVLEQKISAGDKGPFQIQKGCRQPEQDRRLRDEGRQ